jgi:lactate dehydrogenase-like 2-hydroxyacid dehydrogenase
MNVVIAHPLAPHLRKLLPGKVTLATTPAALKRELAKADALVTLLTLRVDAKLLDQAPRLRVVGNIAVGVNNIDLAECARRGVKVVNTPRVLTRATAELTLALLLAAARRLPEGEALCRSGRFRGWAIDMLLGLELRGRHAVILGPGQIGRETARLFRALGISTEFISRRDTERQIATKLRRAQILSIHAPLTPETRHWLGARRLALLPRDAIVLNTARGPLVDEKALIRALKNRRVFAAGLDVYEHEPEIPRALRRLPNVVLLPHLGSATRETREAMARLAVTGVAQVLGGKRPWNLVKFRTKS